MHIIFSRWVTNGHTLQWRCIKPPMSFLYVFRDECIFTIDPLTARDLDDAVSCKQLDNGNFKIGVHISDVTYFLKEGTPLDQAVAKKATSTYLVSSVSVGTCKMKYLMHYCFRQFIIPSCTFLWYRTTVQNQWELVLWYSVYSHLYSSQNSINNKHFIVQLMHTT